MSQGFTKGIPVDTDANMAANSQFLVPSQSAVRAYVGSYAGAANNSAALGGIPASSYALKADLIPGFNQANTSYTVANSAFVTANAALPNTSGVSFGGNLNISGNLAVFDSITAVDSISFNTSVVLAAATANGRMSWNDTEKTVDIVADYINGTTLQVGQEQYIRVKNQTGATIFNGNIVMQESATLGSSGTILGRLAVANGYFDSRSVIGMATQDIPNGGDGFVTTFGKVRGLDTTRFNEGDLIYVDPAIPGGLQNTAPTAPNNKTIIGTVITKHVNVGTYLIRPVYGSSLLEDEHGEFTSIADGDIIQWKTSNNRFENTTTGAFLLSVNIRANAAFDKANSANLLAFNTGVGANAFTSSTVAGANSAVGTGANAFASATISGANTFLLNTIAGANSAVGTGANSYAAAAAAGANAYMIAVQNGSNTAIGTGANAFASATIAGANSAVGTGANAFTSSTVAGANTFFQNTIAGANSAVGTGANSFASATIAGANTFFQNTIAGANSAVGTGANSFASATIAGANTISIAAFNKANAANVLAFNALPNTSGVSFVGNLYFPAGNVGIGVVSTTYKLEVNGSFAAQTKSFVIDHPSKPDMKLRYGSLEGPENGVYVRGKLDGQSVIELPDYWWNLVDPDSITVNLTPCGRAQELWVQSVSAYAINLNQPAECFFTVFAERKDVDKLVVEF